MATAPLNAANVSVDSARTSLLIMTIVGVALVAVKGRTLDQARRQLSVPLTVACEIYMLFYAVRVRQTRFACRPQPECRLRLDEHRLERLRSPFPRSPTS